MKVCHVLNVRIWDQAYRYKAAARLEKECERFRAESIQCHVELRQATNKLDIKGKELSNAYNELVDTNKQLGDVQKGLMDTKNKFDRLKDEVSRLSDEISCLNDEVSSVNNASNCAKEDLN